MSDCCIIEESIVVTVVPEPDIVIVIDPLGGIGPAGPEGPQGPPGVDGDTSAGAIDVTARDSIAAHLIDPTPHPPYDDLPAFYLIFENGLV